MNKAVRKGRTAAEVDRVIQWLTGYDTDGLKAVLDSEASYESFFDEAPQMNPNRTKIVGAICGVRVEHIEEPLTREIRYLDKLIDELAKGKPLERILRE